MSFRINITKQFLLLCITLTSIVSLSHAGYISPIDICASPDGSTLYVAEMSAGKIGVFDTAMQTVTQDIVLPNPNQASGLTLSPDGALLYVTVADPDGKVYVIDTATRNIVDTITTGHYPVSPVISPDGNTLYVCNRFDNTVSAINVATHLQTVIPVTCEPVSTALTADGTKLVVANLLTKDAATNPKVSAVISIIDTASKTVSATVRLPNGSSSVQGICVSPDGQFAYAVHLLGKYHVTPNQSARGWTWTNMLSVVDLNTQSLLSTVLLDDVDLGAGNPWDVQCTADGSQLVVTHAGTHEISVIDRGGLHTAIAGKTVNDMAKDFSSLVLIRRRIGMKGKGPRGLAIVGTNAYLYSHFTAPTTFTGIRPDAETSVRAGLKYAYFNILPETDAVAVDEYLKSLRPVPSPYLVNGQLSAAAANGKLLFNDQAKVNCISCHSGPYTTDMKLHNVGTGIGRHAGTAFDTPTLAEIWRTAPYLYRGQAATIKDVLTTFNAGDKHGNTSGLTEQQINDLAEYVLSIGTE